MARWNRIKHRGNVDDRRSVRMRPAIGWGIGTLVLLMGITYFMGGDPFEILLNTDPSVFQPSSPTQSTWQYEGLDEYEVFASTVLGSNNAFWEVTLWKYDIPYTDPTLILFRGSTSSGCWGAQSLSGPHYCPRDASVYLDETFFEDLQKKFWARWGDVAEAYVIAHEVAHHVQYILGILSSTRTNKQSIQIELQADCFAGLWSHSIADQGVFEKDEIIEAIDAAASVGDDRIQERTMGYSSPESWTHGSSKDREQAFLLGYEHGDLIKCLGYTSL